MSDEQRLVVGEIFSQQNKEDEPRLSPDKYFEIFGSEQVLKSRYFDLDPYEIKSGVVGNGGDGGVDALYLFVNTKLVREDTDLTALRGQQLAIDLVIVQAKNKDSFQEIVLKNFSDFVDNCLKLGSDLSKVSSIYKKSLLDAVARFQSIYKNALLHRPTLSIAFYYTSFGERVDGKVKARRDMLENKLIESFPKAACSVTLAGAKQLLDWFYIVPPKTKNLSTSRQMPWSNFGKAYISLVPLLKFYEFITDNGMLQARIFEANVRDYQGDVTVNREIGATLAGVTSEEFWWLNNGITILASDVTGAGDLLAVTEPLIVNGLQTSYELFNHFKDAQPPDDRTILVRVIESKDSTIRDHIIKATNSQTSIPRAWLHATEEIHRRIEGTLGRVGLYYDRRKNYYRNQGKPARSIVTIPSLSQALVSIVLQRPDDARARPTTAAERHYKKLYSEEFPQDLYSKCALIVRRADEYLDSLNLERGLKLNLVFYLAMYATCVVLRSPRPKRPTIAGVDLDKFTDDVFDNCYERILYWYIHSGGDDSVAKGPSLVKNLTLELQQRFGSKKLREALANEKTQ
jgi:hypothetical protein